MCIIIHACFKYGGTVAASHPFLASAYRSANFSKFVRNYCNLEGKIFYISVCLAGRVRNVGFPTKLQIVRPSMDIFEVANKKIIIAFLPKAKRQKESKVGFSAKRSSFWPKLGYLCQNFAKFWQIDQFLPKVGLSAERSLSAQTPALKKICQNHKSFCHNVQQNVLSLDHYSILTSKFFLTLRKAVSSNAMVLA